MFLLIFVGIFLAIYFIFIDEINTVKDRDPAAKSALEVLLFYPGLHALVFYRMTHQLWEWKVPIIFPVGFRRRRVFFHRHRNLPRRADWQEKFFLLITACGCCHR